jgi:2,4-dienoyl-CoA reductase-like NADH-dependent reductase (Old Yellow Enzyme family)
MKDLVKLTHLFTPTRVKTMELKNRIAMAPMGTLEANEDGHPSERQSAYYEARARGGAGLIMVEDAVVHASAAIGFGEIGLPAIYDDRFIPGWKKLNDVIHAAGAKTCIQLWHPGRQFPALAPDRPPLAPSLVPCPCPLCQDLPHVMTIAEIEELIGAFAQAARRAKDSGFDSVEVSGTHGYLIAQFMSAYANRRTDRYGGDLRSRLRFALETVSAVRFEVGPDFPIIFRFSAEESVTGGRNLDESMAIAPWLVAAGVDCLHVSAGVYANIETLTVAPSYVPKGHILHAAEVLKRVVGVPIMTVGKLNEPLMAEEAIAHGRADIVAVGRGFFADPEWANKAAAGQLEKNKVQVVLGKEADASTVAELKPDVVVVATGGKPRIPDIPGIQGQNVITAQEVLSFKAVTGKRVIVAGGGMVGCETADLLASYGMDVTIVEMLPELASDMAFGPRYYLLQSLEAHKVKVITSACIESVAPQGIGCSRNGLTETIGGIDTVVLAMGASPESALARQLEGKAPQVHVIGDAKNPSNAMEAIAAGARIARDI